MAILSLYDRQRVRLHKPRRFSLLHTEAARYNLSVAMSLYSTLQEIKSGAREMTESRDMGNARRMRLLPASHGVLPTCRLFS